MTVFSAMHEGVRTMYMGEIDTATLEMINYYPLDYKPSSHTIQRNWVPFVSEDNIYLIHTINPSLILLWDNNFNKVSKVVENKNRTVEWHYGEIRGGTPAIYLPDKNAFLSFFQSHKEQTSPNNWIKQWRTYYIGAMLFSSEPPFEVIAYTNKPLYLPNFYQPGQQDGIRIIMPKGLVEQPDRYILSVGIDDYRSSIIEVNKRELLESMVYL